MKRAFTLFEVLMTLAIIAVLAAIAVPHVIDLLSNTRDTQEKANLAQVANVFHAGIASGVEWDISSPEALVRDLRNGREVGGLTFKVSLPQTEMEKIIPQITVFPEDDYVSFGNSRIDL